jgi:pyridoxal phosphate enzyme (YggS family)
MLSRKDEIAANLAQLLAEIKSVALNNNRKADEINLIAVTKGFPASDLQILSELGVQSIGESRDQEIQSKLGVIGESGLSLHFIGQLQRNKVKRICAYSEVIHSVDRLEIVTEIAKEVRNQQRSPQVLLQVDLAATKVSNRGGVSSAELLELAAATVLAGLKLTGLMAIAPLDVSPVAAFERFAQLGSEFAIEHPAANWRSIGMSNDWQHAIAYGATHLRIGSRLLGNRG